MIGFTAHLKSKLELAERRESYWHMRCKLAHEEIELMKLRLIEANDEIGKLKKDLFESESRVRSVIFKGVVK